MICEKYQALHEKLSSGMCGGRVICEKSQPLQEDPNIDPLGMR